MLSSIKLCFNHASKIRCLGIDRPFVNFRPGYNVVIGPNGAGKSTLLEAIALCPHCERHQTGETAPVKYITTEALNPQLGNSFSSRLEMVQGVRALFQSHGQGVLDSLRHQFCDRRSIVVIDSPETGQDHDNSVSVYQGLLQLAEEQQVIIATNNLLFMQSGHLIDLGDRTRQHLIEETVALLEKFS